MRVYTRFIQCFNVSQLIFSLTNITMGRPLSWRALQPPRLLLAMAGSKGGRGRDPQSLRHCCDARFFPSASSSFPHMSFLATARPRNSICLFAAPCNSLSFCQELFPLFRSNRLLKWGNLCGWGVRKQIVSHVNFIQSLCTLYPSFSLANSC